MIAARNLTVFDGFDRPAPLKDDDSADARARMWMASACIFVASGPGSERRQVADGLSEPQLIEWGYFHGQAKPWTIVVRHGQTKNVKNFMISDRSFTTYKDLDKKTHNGYPLHCP